MKLLFLLCLGLHLTVSSSGQTADTSAPKPQIKYLKKSKNQKTAGWILLGGGAALTLGGMVVVAADATDEVTNAVTTGEAESTSSAGGIMLIIGVAAMAGSIPLFIASSKNRRRAAASVSFKIERTTVVGVRDISIKRYPAVSFQIRL